MKKRLNNDRLKSVLYWSLRILQRLALLRLAFEFIFHWIWQISIAANTYTVSQLDNAELDSEFRYGNFMKTLLDRTTEDVLYAALFAGLLTIGLALLPRVRKYEKRIVIDSVLFIAFCILLTVFSQSILGSFISTL